MNPFTRRQILHSAAAGLTLAAFDRLRSAEIPSQKSINPSIIDTNVYLDPWPIRHLRLSEPAALAAKLQSQNVTAAWAGSFNALLHKDIAGVNARLAETCAKHSVFKPIGAVNPSLPRWEDDLERCAAQHQMRGIRLHPNYHGYKLDDARFVALLKLATAQKLFVQIVVGLEDERTQNPLLRISPVDVSPLVKVLESVPEARVMLLNWQRLAGGKPMLPQLKSTRVLFDMTLVEGMMGLEGLLEELPVDRVVFGSYAPVFYFEAAKLKFQESALDEKQVAAIKHENAAGFIAG